MSNDHQSGLVTVVMPLYNSSKFLASAVESVIEQTYSLWELIIVDDCSTDDSLIVAKSYEELDPRISVICLEQNSGAATARNVAIAKAKGEFIAFLDADDYWLEKKLEKQLQFMRRSSAALSFTLYNIVDESGKDTGVIVDKNSNPNISYVDMLAKKATMGCSTVVVNRSVVGDFAMPDIRSGQDYALWLKLLKKGHLAHCLKECLTRYRIVRGSLSSNKMKKAARQWSIYREIEGLSFSSSARYFTSYAIRAMFRKYL